MFLLVPLALAQGVPCTEALLDVFPDDGAVVPSDAVIQVALDPACDLLALRAEVRDSNDQVVEELAVFEGALTSWQPDLIPGGTFTLRLYDGGGEETRTFVLGLDPGAPLDGPPTVSRVRATAVGDATEATLQLTVGAPDLPNLRVHLLTLEGDLVDVAPTTGGETLLSVDLPREAQVCARVQLRPPSGALVEAATAVCSAVEELPGAVDPEPGGRCATGPGPWGPVWLGVLALAYRRDGGGFRG
ncbi:MAG: hypothetical protein H6735_00035 [Alphaproteobacteria bacterium]|nr:hypothetical protein [Alphaproteobacteria bacterium]